MAETITLDPSAVATNRTALDITPWIAVDGIDWDDARIEQSRADGKYGGDPVDYTIPNRQVSVPLVLKTVGGTAFETIRRNVQAKVARFQQEMGWLGRVTAGGTQYADVTNASLHLSGDWLQAYKSVDANAVLSLELKPDWYGAEITLDDQTETAAYSFAKVLKLSSSDAVISGDFPARVRVVVDEDDGDIQMGLLWGIRARYYDSASTAMLSYQAGSLTPLDTAATATISGAAGTVIRHGTLSVNWTPVMSTRILSGAADLTHKGSYRVWARCYSTSGTTPAVRFLWDVGDLVYPVANTFRTIPAANNFYLMDLGEVRLDPVPVGTHRWQGMVQAKGASGGENVAVDRIEFQPLDDGAGRLSATTASDPGLSTFVARDEFNQTSGNLTGKTATVGGNYTGAGDTDDVTVNATGHYAERTATGDVDSLTGRYIFSGATASAAQVVQVDVYLDAYTEYAGAIARGTDANNWFWALLSVSNVGGVPQMRISKRVTGTVTDFVNGPLGSHTIAAWYTVRARVEADGKWFVWVFRQGGSPGDPIAVGQDSALATGGGLATGKIGFYSYRPTLP